MKSRQFAPKLAFRDAAQWISAEKKTDRMAMYEEFFGLKRSPFREKATGNDVFVGPQTAGTMAGFRKALKAQDAVLTVSGVAGTGKTTLVARSVDAFAVRKKLVRVSRMRMNPTDVLESLLIVLGVKNYPAGTIQRFTKLRRTMKEFEDAGVRVFIVVEDALRTGVDTLAEIEALTAADAGESGGASIVLMGDEQLPEFMKHPQLAQLEQRVRRRHKIEPLSAAELRGYLRHCFRLAGGDFDRVFDSKCWELVHQLSGGVPRISNNILEAAMTAAAEQGVMPVTAELVAKVAADEFHLDAGDFDFTADPVPPAVAEEPVVEPKPAPAATPEEPVAPSPLAAPRDEREPAAAPEQGNPRAATPGASPLPTPEPVIAIVDEDSPDDDIPELIQDTLPDLEVLAPELAAPETVLPELQPENAAELVADDIPELEPDSHADTVPSLTVLEPQLAADPVPELPAETDPVPELSVEPEPVPELSVEPEPVPELAVDPEPELSIEPEPGPDPVPDPTAAADEKPSAARPTEGSAGEDVPDWDRDPTFAELKPDLEALEQAMAFAHGANTPIDDEPQDCVTAEDEDDAVDDIPEITLDDSIRTGVEQELSEDPAVELAKRQPAQADAELEKIAAELAKAKTLEDVDDKMAETLFGSEISMIAAQVIGNPAAGEPANDVPQERAAAPEPTAPAPEIPPSPSVTEEVSMSSEPSVPSSAMDLSASQRLKTVRALNADLHPSLREPEDAPAANGTAESPTSIEDQINTSITQTLKALKIPPDVANEDDGESGKGGFFSRFKRS